MKLAKNRILYILVILVFNSCDEFLSTQTSRHIKEFTITENVLTADGQSLTKVNVELRKKPVENQQIQITTTRGILSRLPDDMSNMSDRQSLTLTPDNEDFTFLLHTGRIPDESVMVTITVNKFTDYRGAIFLNNQPSEILTSLNKDSLKLGLNDKVVMKIIPISRVGKTSFNNRFNVSVTYNPVKVRYIDDNNEEIIVVRNVTDVLDFKEVVLNNADTFEIEFKPKVLSFSDTLISEVSPIINIEYAYNSWINSSQTIRVIE